MMRWDVFVCHASEDKEGVVRPLAAELTRRGLRVWLDEHTLNVGDSLRAKIDEGLSDSRYGVVVLSPAFFRKSWPQRELDGLLAIERAGRKVVLPVWHEVDEAEVRAHSPSLAGRVAARTSRGLSHVAADIVRAVRATETPAAAAPEASKKLEEVAARLGIGLQRMHSLVTLQDHKEYVGRYHWMRGSVLADLGVLCLSKPTVDVARDFLMGRNPTRVHDARVAIRDGLALVHGMTLLTAFEVGYQLANISEFCDFLAAVDADMPEQAGLVAEGLRGLGTTAAEAAHLFPGLAEDGVPRWLALLADGSPDRAVYRRIERESYAAIALFLGGQGLPRRSYEPPDGGS